MCSCPDCCRGFLSVSTAALFLVINTILRNLNFGSVFRAFAIAANSPEYGFCSSLLPSVEEKDKISFLGLLRADLCISITPPIPTTPFRAELLTAIRTPQPVSSCLDVDSSAMVCTFFPHGANVHGLTVLVILLNSDGGGESCCEVNNVVHWELLGPSGSPSGGSVIGPSRSIG